MKLPVSHCAGCIRNYLLILCTIATVATGYGQSMLKLPAHTALQQVPWYDSVYQYPDFLPGRMTFATGFSPEGTVLLNYNLYYGQIDLINQQGDTLQVKPSREIKIIEIGEDRYFYDERFGYLEIIQEGQLSLARQTLYATEKVEYVSGAVQDGGWGVDRRGTISNSDRYYMKRSTYYFIDPKNQVRKATRHDLKKILPSKRKAIRHYVDDQAVDFQKESDLRTLATYFSQLMTN
jgi:hypothetical protein